ncbi:polyprenyl synthetase family protein [Microbacterium lacusdiani]
MTSLAESGVALDQVELRLRAYFDRSSERAARHSPQYRELWRELRGAASGGKRLRPRLLLTSYLHLEGGPLEPAIQMATAIELLHTALLLHDDVIDGDLERRGAPNLVGAFAAATAQTGLPQSQSRRWGESAAILGGDLLLASAVRLTAGLDLERDRRERIMELLDESIFRAAAGELADVAYASGIGTPTAADIRDMMADKTAHYSLELPLRAGAILAGASGDPEERLGAIGSSLGIVFQMRDDLLGVFGDPVETGKSTWNDLREGKQTMLIAYARSSSTWASTAELFGSPSLAEAEAQRLRGALEDSGARARLEEEIRRERDTTIGLIREAGLPVALTDLLVREANEAAERLG